MDLVENGVAAHATRITISLLEDVGRDHLALRVEDNGRGMSADVVEHAADPFYTTRNTRAVGLGLSLLRAAAERCEGDFRLDSTPGRGTRVECRFGLSHIDRPPLGDVVTTLTTLVALHPDIELCYEHRAGECRFHMDTAEFQAALGDELPLSEPVVVAALRRHLEAEWEAFQVCAARVLEERAPPLPTVGSDDDEQRGRTSAAVEDDRIQQSRTNQGVRG